MKNTRFYIAGFITVILCLGIAGCDGSNYENISPLLNWRAVYSFYEDAEGITGPSFEPAFDEEEGLPFNEEDCLSVAYGNGIIVVGGVYSGKIAYSKDKGDTWEITDSGLNYGIRSIAFANGTFIAGGEVSEGEEEDEDFFTEDFISLSSNGKDWVLASADWIDSGRANVLSAGNSFFVKNQRGVYLYCSRDNGQTWEGYDGGDDVYMPRTLKGISYGNGIHVLVGNNRSSGSGSGEVLLSRDGGVMWEGAVFYWNKNKDGEIILATELLEDEELYDEDSWGRFLRYTDDIIFGDGTFIVSGSDYYGYEFTDDEGNEAIEKNIHQYDDGIDANMLISTDGVNWIRRDCGMESALLGFGSGTFVALDVFENNKAIYSTDKGVTWKPAYSNFGSATLFKMSYGSNYFIATGFNYKNGGFTSNIFYSDDIGKTWKTVESQFDGLLTDILHADGAFIAVGENGKIYIAEVK